MNEGAPQEKNESAPLVLVVDDDPDILSLAVHGLETHGYRTETATNGVEALEAIEKEAPGLILLDMKMPEMDGWSFVQEFRNRYGRSIPIVVMTAAEVSTVRADEVGADSYLGKSFQLSDLIEVVEDTVAD